MGKKMLAKKKGYKGPKMTEPPAKRKKDGSGPSTRPPPRKVSDSTWSKKRLENLQKKSIRNTHHLDWAVIREYGMEEPVRRLLETGPWETLFSIRESAYRDITLEFLSTMKMRINDIEEGVENSFSFQVYGQVHNLSIRQFSAYMGLYPQDFTTTEAFEKLNVSWPENVKKQGY